MTKSRKEEIYGSNSSQDYEEYEPKKINWKKTLITLSIVITVITGAVLIWLFVFKGKEYLEYRKEAKASYSEIFVEADRNEVENLVFRNSRLKQSTLSMVDSIKSIYSNDDGFDFGSVHDFKYTNSYDFQHAAYGHTDYLYGFVIDNLAEEFKKLNPTQNSQIQKYYPQYLSHRPVIRIIDGKIAAIGFKYSNNMAYDWLDGSYTKNLTGGR